ncbi:MAG: TonB-dependent receptor, partial [Acidobacteria bacterium]|nr:TonB-dependent receptor [Acidobacteriota bacterium]
MLLAALALIVQSAVASPIAGLVVDISGAVVTDARVAVAGTTTTPPNVTTGPDGSFTFTVPTTGTVTVVVTAPGFLEWRRTMPVADAQRLRITLTPAGVLETLTVTPTRSALRLGDVPSSMSVLGREDLRQSPSVLADDVLRRLPSFSLFRRTSSMAAHPTAQGVSLRGIGPSGVSRTLVLVDGIPANDPFGGWVYWSRIPLEQAERVEVIESASSDLYGNYALGGVVNIVNASPRPGVLSVRAQSGSLETHAVEAYGSHSGTRAGVAVDAGYFTTGGYAPVVIRNPAGTAERGLVDNNVSLDVRRLNVRTDLTPSTRVRGTVRVGWFDESRNNGKHSTFTGTPEQNDTEWISASGSLTAEMSTRAQWEATFSMGTGTLRSNFLAVPATTPARSIGRMTLNQRVPVSSYAGMAQTQIAAGRHALTIGADWRWVDGDSEEDGLDAQTGTTVTLRRVSGGTQQAWGGFVQDVFTPTAALTMTAGARIDRWRTYNGHNLEQSVPSGALTAAHNPALPARSDTVVSPRVAAMYRVSDRLSLWGNLAAGFRAPTLNELYRQFRVGTVLTLANNQLGPERLWGHELGVQFQWRTLAWRTNWFESRMTDPVSNVTISTSGANVTQQRQNLGATRVSGVQSTMEYRLGATWRLSAAYIHQRSRVIRTPANTALLGKWLPQVPRHRATAAVSFTDARLFNASLELSTLGTQFDDDLNVRTVP